MTHHDSGHFSAKHPNGTNVPPALQQAVSDQIVDKGITCHAAHAICEALHVTPREVGIAIDLQEGFIRKCQLGLFGYGPKIKAVKAAEKVPPELGAAIEAALVDGRLACAEAWRIADAAGIARLAVANACEALKIKIKPCQLGAF
ncbi:MAG: hypothetical protein HZB24_16515 [Desulfobacterales bacterium]|nr:hypothetical protein [Desulfobacterales bacterium]